MNDEVYFIKKEKNTTTIGSKPTIQRELVICTIDGLDTRLTATLFGSANTECFQLLTLRNLVPYKPSSVEINGVEYKVNSYHERGNKVLVIVNE